VLPAFKKTLDHRARRRDEIPARPTVATLRAGV